MEVANKEIEPPTYEQEWTNKRCIFANVLDPQNRKVVRLWKIFEQIVWNWSNLCMDFFASNIKFIGSHISWSGWDNQLDYKLVKTD